MGILRTNTGRLRTGWRILLFILLFAVFLVVFSVLPLQGLNWETVPSLLAGLLAGWIVLSLDHRKPGALGFHLSRTVPQEALLSVGLGVGVGMMVVCAMAVAGGIWWTPEDGSWWGFLRQGLLALWFFTLPAAAEEILFRGYLLQALAESWGALEALWVTSVAFGLLHLANPNTTVLGIVNIVLAGVFLGAVYLKTASLWWATGAHLGWNWALGYLADLPVSGLELVDSPIYEGAIRGAPWVSGGTFGPEGSLMATLGLGLAAYLVWKSPRLRPGKHAMNLRPLVLSEWGPEPDSKGAEGGSELESSRSEA